MKQRYKNQLAQYKAELEEAKKEIARKQTMLDSTLKQFESYRKKQEVQREVVTKEKRAKVITLRKAISQVRRSRDVIKKMAENGMDKTPFGRKYLNLMANEVANRANEIHPKLPFYLVTSRI